MLTHQQPPPPAAYLFSTRLLLTRNGIYTSAPAGRLLLIPNIASRAALFISPILMTLVAFKISARWLRAMPDENDGELKEGDMQETRQGGQLPPSTLQSGVPTASQVRSYFGRLFIPC